MPMVRDDDGVGSASLSTRFAGAWSTTKQHQQQRQPATLRPPHPVDDTD